MPTLLLIAALQIAASARGAAAHEPGPTQGRGVAAMVLDANAVARLASVQAPVVQTETARRAEAEAWRKHADVGAGGNPELALTVGPGWVNPGSVPAIEFMALITWPFDLSRSAGARQNWANSRTTEADLSLDDATRLAVGEALDLFALACGAQERVAVAQARVALDAELVRIARVRRGAGAVGDGELALANVLRAGGEAVLQAALGEFQAVQAVLKARLGLPESTRVELHDDAWPAPAPWETLQAQLAQRPDLLRARTARQSATLDETVQRRLGWSVPRVTVGAGRGPEYQGELGLTVPLPVYQRNQVNAAVAGAHVATVDVEATLLQQTARADLRAALARFESARAAHELLQASQAAIEDAEHLALRGFELGQDPLATTVVARREAVNARMALQEAKLTMTRARTALCTVAGTCLTEVAR